MLMRNSPSSTSFSSNPFQQRYVSSTNENPSCYVPAGLQRPQSRSAAVSSGNGGHQPPIARGSNDAYAVSGSYYTTSSFQGPTKMSHQIAQCATTTTNGNAAPSTPVKRTPLGDASFITQAARSTPTSTGANSSFNNSTPMKQYRALHQYSPVKAPPTPSRPASCLSSVSKANNALLRPHPLQHHRPLLVLDLDETLVHASVETSDGNHDVAFVVEMNNQKINVYVKIRPLAREFLRRVAMMFEVCVFTASLAPYADRVVDYLDPAGQLVHHRLYREHCTNVEGNYIKDMSLMGRSMERIAIVDNSPVAYSFQPENAIPILSWFDDRNDRELMEMMPMLEHFAQTCDYFHTSKKFGVKA